MPAWLRAPLLTIPSHFSLISVCHKASETYCIIVCVCVSTVRSLIALKSVVGFHEIRFETLTESYQGSTMSAFYRTILKLFFSDCCPPTPPSTIPISALRINLTLRCSVKTIIITYSECMSVALVIQHALRLQRILSSVACHMFSHFHINGKIFRKKELLKKNV